MKSIKELKSFFDKYFEDFRKLDVYCWVAGGAVRDFLIDEEPKDIDLFFLNSVDQNKAKDYLTSTGFSVLSAYPNHYTMERRGELCDLLVSPKSPTDCIHKFDYSICSAALDINLNFYHHPNFFEHLKEKKLVRSEQSDRWAITNVKRLRKFLKKGYSMDKENLIQYLDDQEATFEYRKNQRHEKLRKP